MRPRLGAAKHQNGVSHRPRAPGQPPDRDTPRERHPTETGTAPEVLPLSAQTETLDQRAVALDVLGGQVLQQPAALTHQLVHAAAGVVVVLVRLQVLGQVVDPLGQQRDLDLRGAGVTFGGAVLGEDLLLRGDVECHGSPSRLSTRAHSVLLTSTNEPGGASAAPQALRQASLSDLRSAFGHAQWCPTDWTVL